MWTKLSIWFLAFGITGTLGAAARMQADDCVVIEDRTYCACEWEAPCDSPQSECVLIEGVWYCR